MNKKAGIWFLLIGWIFILNPTLNGIDILPDFIGYLFILLSIKKPASLIEKINETKKSLIILIIAEILKFIISLFENRMNPSAKVLYIFLFIIVECIIFIPSVCKIFDGFDYLSLRFSSNNDFYSSNIKAKSIVIFVIHEILVITPVLPALLDSSLIRGDFDTNWLDFTNIYYLITSVLGIIPLIIIIISLVKFIKNYNKDDFVIELLNKKYYEKVDFNINKNIVSIMNIVLVFILLSTIGTMTFYIDGINFIPNIISALLIGTSLLLISILSESNKILCYSGIITSLIWSGFSIYNIILQIGYKNEYYKPASVSYGIKKAIQLYSQIEIFSVIESIFFIITITIFIIQFNLILNNHISKLDRTNTNNGLKAKKSLIICLVFLIIVILINISYTFINIYFPFIWVINDIVSILLFSSYLYSYKKISDNIYFKIRL